ncbi:CHAT domain-containing protein [Cladorrhinum sp. PSN259]|nr:CHAT domain-containing protein [Cladorrhinum sp. PSN259]
MESIQDILDRVRQATNALTEHPGEPSPERLEALEKVIKTAEDASERLTELLQQPATLQEVNRVIDYNERVLSLVPENHKSRITFLTSLITPLDRRFTMMGVHGNPNDMDRALDLAQEVVSVTREGTQQRVNAWINFHQCLENRYMQTRDEQYIKRAITVAEQAAEERPEGSPYIPLFLNKLAISLTRLFEHNPRDNLDVARKAIAAAQSAKDAADAIKDAEEAALGSNTLARALGRRFEQTGVMADLERAIGLLTESLPRIPKETPRQIMYYAIGSGYLANLLATRFEQEGDVTDLDASIQYMESVLSLVPQKHPDRPVQLFNKANRFAERGKYNRQLRDLDAAIACGEEALKISESRHNHPERANWLRGLSQFYGMRFTLSGSKSLDDLERAIYLIKLAEKVVDPKDIVMRAALANVLSYLLLDKYEQDHEGNVASLDEAIVLLERTLQGPLPDTHPDRGDLEYGLGRLLRTRYLHALDDDITDMERSREAFQRAWACLNGPLTIRIDAASRAAELSATRAQKHFRGQDPQSSSNRLRYWKEASTYLDHAVGLLHALSPRHVQNVNKQHMLKRFAGLGAHAAAAALNAKEPDSIVHALHQLELGRGIIAGLALDLRTDMSFLREKHPDWADRLARLRDIWDSGRDVAPSTGSWESGGQARRQAQKELDALLTQIRGEEGFERFLMSPTVDQLKEAVDPDPAVVVNVSSFRCDAFIVVKNRDIQLLELPLLKLEDIEAKTKELKDVPNSLPAVLEWLWLSTVHPVLDALGFNRPLDLKQDKLPHIWWIPVGPLSNMPLHAAGFHTKGSGETALDRVMSSYSLSLKSLLAGRLQKMPKYDLGSINCLLVSMKTTPYRDKLPYAELEVDMVEKLCPALNATPIRPVENLKKGVLAHLSQCDIFHFAGHGTSDISDPSRSRLLLRDWQETPLTVEDLRNQKLQEPKPPFLAYLSACSTGANEVLQLSDEGIHLGYACQLAGFRHVVGALWPVSDRYCVDVARKFYETICDEGMTDAAVHRGLHLALRELRDVQVEENNRGSNDVAPENGGEGSRKGEGVDDETGPSMNSLWVPFVHFGV